MPYAAACHGRKSGGVPTPRELGETVEQTQKTLKQEKPTWAGAPQAPGAKCKLLVVGYSIPLEKHTASHGKRLSVFEKPVQKPLGVWGLWILRAPSLIELILCPAASSLAAVKTNGSL